MSARIPLVDYLVIDGGEPYLQSHECTGCGALYFDRRNACAKCGGREFGVRRLAGEGTLRSFTIVHRAAPGVPVPYVSALVDLAGGGVVQSNLVGVQPDPAEVKLGMPVRLTTFAAGTDDEGTEAVAFGFEPAS